LRPRSTALLYGPPGTGKTTLAHHLAARLGVPLVIVGPETIFGRYMGDSERSMGQLFDNLDKAGVPCVLFMDEVEALGGHRSKNTSGGADNGRTSTLGVLLRKIEAYKGYCLGATNRKDDIDPALWRRFHLQISIDLPGDDERFSILKRYMAPFSLPDEDMDILVEATDGASPAMLRGLMEGLKRNMIVRPRLNMPVDTAWRVMRSVIESMAAPPEMETPPLWRGEAGMAFLERLTWPPAREVA
jgi:SpoVK/Ycf46/Vps4 family AAA+-type ATPase